MKFGASRSGLFDAQKTARAKWDEAGATWDDEVRRRHAEAIVEPFDQYVTNVLRAVDQLAVLFTEIRQDIEYQD